MVMVLKMGVSGGDVRQTKGSSMAGISAIEKLYLTKVLLVFYCGAWGEENLERLQTHCCATSTTTTENPNICLAYSVI